MATDMTTLRTVESLEVNTPEIDREVTLYNSDGDIRVFWRVRQFGTIVLVETRKPGKKPKVVSMVDYERVYSAEAWAESAIKDREKRVPVIRKEKAEAKLRQIIADSKTDILKLVCWSRNGSGNYMFKTREEIFEDHKHWDLLKAEEPEQVKVIIEALRHKGGSYFGGLKLLRHFNEQLKPGGLADQLVDGTIDLIEKNLIPWAYVAGHLRAPVMLSNEKRRLAVQIVNRHTDVSHEDLGFYKEGTTVASLVETIYSRFVEDVKPSVLDALTLE